MRKWIVLLVIFLVTVFIYINNSSLLVEPTQDKATLLAHRGIHQTYSKDGIDNKTCTAKRIYTPKHDYIENTIASMKEAFRLGADRVEIDIHPTTDGHFAVFHDWTLECRTNGTGVTREHSLSHLKTLDIGYGYTADNGKTYPLRGKGIGLIPSLNEVLTIFPDKRFLINFKSNDAKEGDLLAKKIKQLPQEQQNRLMVYGGEKPTKRFLAQMPDIRGFTKKSVKDCALRYLLIGWSGFIPKACENTALILPLNYAPWLWGWPERFAERMKNANTTIFLAGPRNAHGSVSGIDTKEQMPENYTGVIWTNRIEVLAGD